MRQGVGISNKAVTPRNGTPKGARSKATSQIKTVFQKSRPTSFGRWMKLGLVGVVVISFSATSFVSRVISSPQYVAPQARLANPVETRHTASVDEVVAAEVAAVVAKETGLLVTPDITNRAVTLDAQSSMAAQTDDSIAPSVDKPQYVASSDQSSQGIITITAKEGDTLDKLAEEYGISEDTIRWANNLGSGEVKPGSKLKILPVSGVLYTVQPNDTVDSIARVYSSSSEQISAFNDVELRGLKPGTQILIPDGTKPAASAPVSPAAGASAAASSVSNAAPAFGFGGSSPIFSGNGYSYGYCTWYAFNRRAELGRPIASNWGHASTWAALARASGFEVNQTPRAGAVFQTAGGWGGYGHVGIVEKVLPNGDLMVSEMNYAGWNIVTKGSSGRGNIPASQVSLYQYIH